MDFNTKLKALNHIYTVYNMTAGEWNTACEKYCARCCTRNVTLTTLEAFQTAEHPLIQGGQLLEKLKTESGKKRFHPLITTNEMADICVKGDDIPDEESNPEWGACPFLENNECPIYEMRPFACRCMVSSLKCSEDGYADMEPFMLTVNNIFLQYIEHIDAQGYSGNLTDMLLFMSNKENRLQYIDNMIKSRPEGLILNRPASVLMIPPEHREKMKPIIKALNDLKL